MATTTTAAATVAGGVRQASTLDTLRIVARVIAPLVAQGAIIRRPVMTARAQRHGWDRRAIGLLASLRHRYGDGPLRLRIPGRDVALVLSSRDAARTLDETPEPFAAATREKRAALRHFQPDGVLIS